MTDRPPTDKHSDMGFHREVTHPIIMSSSYYTLIKQLRFLRLILLETSILLILSITALLVNYHGNKDQDVPVQTIAFKHTTIRNITENTKYYWYGSFCVALK